MAGHFFDNATASIASGEITVGVDAGRIFTENGLHPADLLHDLGVLQFRELAQTSNGAGDEHQVICFCRMLAEDDVARTDFGLLLNPFVNRGERELFLM